MIVLIAKTPMGVCPCGLPVEPLEAYSKIGGTAVHVGCEDKAQRAETAPTLFALTPAAPDPEPKKPARTFTPVSLDAGQQANAPRLMGQLGRTYDLMSDGKWRTLTEIAVQLGALETSAGARLRDLRKPAHGGHLVLCQLRADGSGEREYRLVSQTSGVVDAA